MPHLSVNAGAGCAAPDDAPSAVSDPDADAVPDADDDAAADDDAVAADADSDADSDDASAEAFGAALASPLCGTVSCGVDNQMAYAILGDFRAFNFSTHVTHGRHAKLHSQLNALIRSICRVEKQ